MRPSCCVLAIQFLKINGAKLLKSNTNKNQRYPAFTDVVSISTTDGRAAGLTECAIIAIAGETRPNYGIEKTCQIWKTRLEYGLQQLEKRKQRTHFGLLLWQSGACNRPQEKVPRIWIQIPQRGLLNHIMPAARRRIRAK